MYLKCALSKQGVGTLYYHIISFCNVHFCALLGKVMQRSPCPEVHTKQPQ